MGLLQAQMVAGTEVLIDTFPQDTLQELRSMMNEVSTCNSEDIRIYERQNGFEWDSFLSLQYLYEPKHQPTSKSTSSVILQLSKLATDILLLSFETTIWKVEHVEVLVEQDLLEYLIMLPWSVPLCSRERARTVVTNVAKIRQIQPPSLSSISKAKLAKMKWGLKKLRDIKSISYLMSQFP